MQTSKITLLDLAKDNDGINDGIFFLMGGDEISQPLTHYHDFFEISLVLEGVVEGNINGESFIFNEGGLMVIRPYDVHHKTLPNGLVANLGISENTFNLMFNYLGNRLDRGRLTRMPVTPHIEINKEDLSLFRRRLDQVHLRFRGMDTMAAMEVRVLVLDLMTKFVPQLLVDSSSQVPAWLEEAVMLMEQPEMFVQGLPALLNITKKSQPYLCRVFKQHYNLTPTQFINGLRLKYAAHLLATSTIDIMELSAEAGFESLSYFYHCFKQFYSLSPKAYRKLRMQPHPN